MSQFYKVILVVILIISASNLLKTLFEDNALKNIETQLKLTKRSLDSAITSNHKAKKEVENLNQIIEQYRLKNEKFQNEIDIIDLEYERSKVATLKRRKIIDSLLKVKNERLIILKAKDSIFD
ncbi:hypothetical protein KO493_10250 [Tamlana agarivorans]|uniref:Uncharacterized protein n=1 Tax=Pseudotamlana agarivorans TaxID=481183 RepID=A0ACC5U9X2_9FLAO|nr:hypothetical protein [Tamlana agarivorans]MBU2951076.1 hypothetical protein [Tamlana agarivorans]